MAMFSESGLTAAGGSVVSYKEKINYLKRYIWLDRRINKKLEQLTEWRSRLGKLVSIHAPARGATAHLVIKIYRYQYILFARKLKISSYCCCNF